MLSTHLITHSSSSVTVYAPFPSSASPTSLPTEFPDITYSKVPMKFPRTYIQSSSSPSVSFAPAFLSKALPIFHSRRTGNQGDKVLHPRPHHGSASEGFNQLNHDKGYSLAEITPGRGPDGKVSKNMVKETLGDINGTREWLWSDDELRVFWKDTRARNVVICSIESFQVKKELLAVSQSNSISLYTSPRIPSA